MGHIKGFLQHDRQEFDKESSKERIGHWKEFVKSMPKEQLASQGARCMDCGVPFCQSGCPVSNIIPDFNDLVFNGRWGDAIKRLHKTNNFPEFTGRVCPAPCENSCVLGYNYPAVTIKNIEKTIIENAYSEGWIKPQPPKHRTGKKIAVVGSGPAGLACADQLNKRGHTVTVYEKNEVLGGLLTLGIPDYKLEKTIIERRLKLMKDEGVNFKTKAFVGVDIPAKSLIDKYDAVAICGGAEQPRDLNIDGRELKGVYFALEFLHQQNRVNNGLKIDGQKRIDVKGKNVVVLGGGDTGSDCVGTSNRQGAASIKQFELLPQPPQERDEGNPWPQWALIDRISTSHEEGVDRDFCVMTKSLSGENGELKKLHAIRLEFGEKDSETGRRSMKELPGSEFTVDVDYVFLAMGFLGPVKNGMLDELGCALDSRGNVKCDDNKMTSVEGVFAAGDMARGQSLVVWAIHEGRIAAEGVQQYLMNQKMKA